MALIDLSNYDDLLNQSTTSGRSGTPNGNIFFDVTNGILELITVEEQATVIITDTTHPQYTDGTTPIANPLTEDDGIKLEALYAFERQERRKDETLRQYDYYFEGTFKFGGAYKFVNGRKLYDADAGGADSLTGDDRFKIRGSGWEELDTNGELCRIYYGNKSLGNIEAASLPYYQLHGTASPDTNTIEPVIYDKDGPIDEAVQVFGDITYDTNTTTFDTRVFESLKIRTFGYNYDEKVLSDSGVTEMGGYASGFALAETVHLTSGSYTLADVLGGAQISPWTGMGLEELDTPQTETGFTTADGNFTWTVNNTVPGNLDEVTAFMDALAQDAADINDHATNTTFGKRVGVWYSYNAAGKILPKVGTGAVGEGLFYEGLTGTDKNRVIFTDDAGATKEYPSYSNVSISVGSGAVADALAWFHGFFEDGPGANDFNTANAVTVQTAQSADVKGDVDGTGFSSGNNIIFEFDWYLDTLGGPVETDKNMVFECEGDGGVTAAKTIVLLTSAASITASCVPGVENNV